jgi:putative PIN family toxin of toxin-antitoxin system
MRIVLDTNIFVSALLWGGKPREILERVLEGKDELFISRPMLNELFEVLKRPKFMMDEGYIELFIREIEDIAKIVVVSENIRELCRDVDDNKIIECALEARADCLITGDNDLLVLKRYGHLEIVELATYFRKLEEHLP